MAADEAMYMGRSELYAPVAPANDVIPEQLSDPASPAELEARFRSAFHEAPIGLGMTSVTGDLQRVNPVLCSFLGRSEEELLGQPFGTLVHPEDWARHPLQFEEPGTRPVVPRTQRFVRRDGRVMWGQVHATLIRALSGDALHGIVHVVDVTQQKRHELLLTGQTRVLEMVARGAPLPDTLDTLARAVESATWGLGCSIVLVDHNGLLRWGTPPNLPPGLTAALEGIPAKEGNGVCATAVATGKPVVVADVAAHGGELAIALAPAGVLATWAVPFFGSSGDEVLGAFAMWSAEARPPRPDEWLLLDQFASLVAIAIERKRAEADLSYQALHDPLTGLPNRALFLDRLRHALARRHPDGTAPGVAVLLLDLDRFKVVNDSLGHDAGDRLLVAVARRLEEAVRDGDTIARFGGDELTVLCEQADGVEDAAIVAKRLTEAVAAPFVLDSTEVFLTASVGIALADADGRPENLLRDADSAMYRAKARGGSGWEVFDDTMRQQALERLGIENSLHRAMERDEMRVHYQPEINLRTGEIVGVEALVRWQHPAGRLIGPDEFIGAAEDTGLILSIGSWVLTESCRWAAPAQTRSGQGLKLWVNLSARQLVHPELPTIVEEALDASGLPPRRLFLEITESVVMDDAGMAISVLRRLKALGVGLGIDDFGTGYSSLSYLKRLPVDFVKIDRSFVKGLGEDSEDAAIVRAIISLAHSLGLTTIAEGVETPSQLRHLRSLGCHLAQGFHMSRAVPGEQLEALLRDAPRW